MGKKQKQEEAHGPALYKLLVTLAGGPVTQEFLDRNPEVSRTIAIRGDQTLDDLHWAIYSAFDREEAHLYEFQFGKNPHDRKAKCYVSPELIGGPVDDFLRFASSVLNDWGEEEEEEYVPNEDASQTTIGSLPLKTRSSFWYRFDFGDEWWHKVKVVSIQKECPGGEYPQVVERVGESPPQYPDLDEE